MQVYMELQPDWEEEEAAVEAAGQEGQAGSCWLNVYERSVHVAQEHESGQAVAPPTVASCISQHFQVPFPVSTPMQQAHQVEVMHREKHWLELRVPLASAISALEDPACPRSYQPGCTHGVRGVFQAPTVIWDVTQSSDHAHVLSSAVASSVEERRTTAPRAQLHAVDVANDGALVAVGGTDGLCRLWRTSGAPGMTHVVPLRSLAGHLADVTRTRFFPSGKVLLTGSLDRTLRIWSTESAQCAAILKGHVGGITDVVIVGRGRNVISSSSDGAIHLWSCGSQAIVAQWDSGEQHSAVHTLALMEEDPHPTERHATERGQPSSPTTANQEFETDGKLLLAGLDDGQVLAVDVRSRELAWKMAGHSPVRAIAGRASSHHGAPIALTGSEDGLLTAWDIRQTSTPLHVVSRSSSAIHRIILNSGDDDSFSSRDSVWTAHGDGVCANWSGLFGTHSDTEVSAPRVTTQLTGPQYDPVRDLAMAATTGHIFTACRDGLVRDYIPHFMAPAPAPGS